MREAVILSTARTPFVKSHRGEFNITPGPTLASFAMRAAVQRARTPADGIEDIVLGCGYPEGRNIAPGGHPFGAARLRRRHDGEPLLRLGRAGDAIAAGRLVVDGAPAVVAGQPRVSACR